jgi:hypothetical protein
LILLMSIGLSCALFNSGCFDAFFLCSLNRPGFLGGSIL